MRALVRGESVFCACALWSGVIIDMITIMPSHASRMYGCEYTPMMTRNAVQPPMSWQMRSNCSVVMVLTLSTFSARNAVSSVALP